MTQEEKQLLLKDLCGRLPYGVKCQIDYDNEEDTDLGIERYCDDRIVSVCMETEEIGLYEASEYFYPEEIHPYLRPLSSMTEEEENEFFQINFTGSDSDIYGKLFNVPYADEVISWLNSNGFDFRGLIPRGLAIEAPEDMYKSIKTNRYDKGKA